MASHLYPPGKAPPYTYDDARILYDEECFLYDGGFDEVCLTDITPVEVPRKFGGGGGMVARRRPYVPPPAPNPLLDIRFKVCLKSVNDSDANAQCVETHWKREIPKTIVDTHLSGIESVKRFVYSTLAGSQVPQRFVSTELTAVQPVEKKLISTGDVKVSTVGPVIQVVKPIKKTIAETVSVISKTSIKQPSKIYLRKSIIVIPKPKE